MIAASCRIVSYLRLNSLPLLYQSIVTHVHTDRISRVVNNNNFVALTSDSYSGVVMN